LKRSLATWKRDDDTLPTLDYEALDVAGMELPPGWRGYGAKDYVEHPGTSTREQEVQTVRERITGQGGDRFAVQDALMPYEHLLPERYRSRNERIDEGFA
jgi:fumarate reductase flavoprotein subunit